MIAIRALGQLGNTDSSLGSEFMAGAPRSEDDFVPALLRLDGLALEALALEGSLSFDAAGAYLVAGALGAGDEGRDAYLSALKALRSGRARRALGNSGVRGSDQLRKGGRRFSTTEMNHLNRRQRRPPWPN